MSDKYYAWLQSIQQRDNALLILTLAGIALAVGWIILDNLKLPDKAKRICQWGYALSTFGLYWLTILVGVFNA